MTTLKLEGLPTTADEQKKRDVLQQMFDQLQRTVDGPPELWEAVGLLIEQGHTLGLMERQSQAHADAQSILDDMRRRIGL